LYGVSRILGLAAFKTIPYTQLIIVFYGQYLSDLIHKNAVIGYYLIYPVLIFGVLRLMKYVNTKLDLRMDMVGEIYTIFYAVFPYKIMYLNLKSLLPGLIIIAIKCIFKAVVFVIVPCLKRTSSKLAPREKSLKKQSGPEI
jgi:hypothetical protein